MFLRHRFVPGTAVYVFFILANDAGDGITTLTEFNVTLDGSSAGRFLHNNTVGRELQYNAAVFSREGLANTQHTVVLRTASVPYDVFLNFDYAVYTYVVSIELVPG